MEAAQARLSVHLSKCHIVGNHMSRLNSYFVFAVTLSIKEAALDAFVDTIEPRTEV